MAFLSRKNSKSILTFWGWLGVLILLFIAWNTYALVRNLPNPSRIADRAVVESTKIYDRTGKILLYEIHGEEKRTVVRLAEVPDYVKYATLAAEDVNFYQPPGIDIKGIFRAIFINLKRGDFSQGGSTITQQLVKSSLLGPEKTIQRKIREQILALILERKYSKDEILEWYLNQIPYGSNAYGIAAAAQTYFSKTPQELTLEEAALLAALPKAPTYYSPYGSHQAELGMRREWILNRMSDLGWAAKEDVVKAKTAKLNFLPPTKSIRAPHFVQYVRELLNEKYGEAFVERDGLKVVTTLDWELQEEAEKIIKEGAEQNEKSVKAANASLVSIDPKTGEILSMVGSKDYFAKPSPDGCAPGISCRFDPHVNVVLRPRQPGSAFKPFVYATAFRKGYTPETVLFDAFTEFNPNCTADGTPGPLVANAKDCYNPGNYDEKFRGPVTLRQALAQSLNLPSVKLLYLAGIQDSIKTAQGMGITTLTEPDRYGLSLVLGGAEVKLLEMVSAFGVFAQEGVLHPPTALLRIETSSGLLWEEKKEKSLPVLDTEIARTINEVLSDNDARVPVFSPTSSLYFPGRSVAAKTGTTQESRDAWVIGYTPSLVTGVWVGNSDNTPMHRSSLSVMVAAPMWRKFMDRALAEKPPEEFTPAAKITPEKPALRGHYRIGEIIKIDKISKKLATAFTPLEMIEEINTGEVRSILAFIKKDDPLGDPPSNPFQDPQYRNWGAGVERWIATHPLFTPAVPTEYDDIHGPSRQPQIQILRPPDESVSGILNEIEISVKSPLQLKEISLFVDDFLVESKTNLPANNIVFPLNPPLDTGAHRIKITVYDTVGNKSVLEKTIQIYAD